MFIKLRFSIIIAVIAVFYSCGTTRLSQKDISDFDAGRVAIIQTYNQPLLGSMLFGAEPVTQIISVDGKKIKSAALKLDEQVVVEIGVHKVEFSCVSRKEQDERDYTEVLELNLKPYYRYLVRCSFDSDFGSDGTYTGSFSVKEKYEK